MPCIDGEGKPVIKESPYSDEQGLSQREHIAALYAHGQRPCPLSLAFARQLSQRESRWQVGSLSADRRKFNMAQKIVPCYRGQQLRDNIPCQAAVNLCRRALLFSDKENFARLAWA